MDKGREYMQKLADYVKKNAAKGYPIESLRWALVNQGHSRVQVDKAVRLATEQMAEAAPKMTEKPVVQETEINTAKKKGFFEWLFGDE